MRWYSMAGMMAPSASPRRRASAHWEGVVKERSYLPARGPSVKPQTRGAVLRYSTMEMRSLDIFRAIVAQGVGLVWRERVGGEGQNGWAGAAESPKFSDD